MLCILHEKFKAEGFAVALSKRMYMNENFQVYNVILQTNNFPFSYKYCTAYMQCCTRSCAQVILLTSSWVNLSMCMGYMWVGIQRKVTEASQNKIFIIQ